MTTITLLSPLYEDTESKATVGGRAPREAVTEPTVITLIDNGKPNAKPLLTYVAQGLESRLPVATVDIHSKPSAGKTIDADEADMLAARSRLVITGVGD